MGARLAGAREGAAVAGTLLAVCLLASGAPRAMEPVQPGAFGTFAAPALPSFLDDETLPALQEAWREREAAPQTGPETTPTTAPQARETIEGWLPTVPAARVEDQTAPASVRQRAEELSRRFNAGAASSAPFSAPSTPPAAASSPVTPSAPAAPAAEEVVVVPPAVIPAETLPDRAPESAAVSNQAVVKNPALPERKANINGPKVDTTATLQVEESPEQAALLGQRLRLAAPPPPPDSIPPLPRRAPKSRTYGDVPASVKKAAVARSKPVRASTPSTGPPSSPPADPLAPLRGSILSNELRAFGWNSQPN